MNEFSLEAYFITAFVITNLYLMPMIFHRRYRKIKFSEESRIKYKKAFKKKKRALTIYYYCRIAASLSFFFISLLALVYNSSVDLDSERKGRAEAYLEKIETMSSEEVKIYEDLDLQSFHEEAVKARQVYMFASILVLASSANSISQLTIDKAKELEELHKRSFKRSPN